MLQVVINTWSCSWNETLNEFKFCVNKILFCSEKKCSYLVSNFIVLKLFYCKKNITDMIIDFSLSSNFNQVININALAFIYTCRTGFHLTRQNSDVYFRSNVYPFIFLLWNGISSTVFFKIITTVFYNFSSFIIWE